MDYFEEKAQQITDPETTAFGIPICTRYGKADEMVEMLNFARFAAMQDVHGLVKEVFYDSKASLCTIELHDELSWHTVAGERLLECATLAIRQFQADGQIFHGLNLVQGSGDPDF